MPWKPGECGNPHGRPRGRLPKARSPLVLRELLERMLVDNQAAVESTILRIIRSPHALPKLLTLFGKLTLEISPPAMLVEVALEEQSRTQWLAERVAQLAAANGPISTFVNPPAPVEAAPSPAVDVPLSLHAPLVREEPSGAEISASHQSESPSNANLHVNGAHMHVPPAEIKLPIGNLSSPSTPPSSPRPQPVPPPPRAREELEALRQGRRRGGA